MSSSPFSLSVAAAVSDDTTLRQCLLASPEVAAGRVGVRTYADQPSAAIALNRGLRDASSEWVVLAHQDVYFPAGSLTALARELAVLGEAHPRAAVVGAIGRLATGDAVGTVWSSGMGKVVGSPIDRPHPVATIDEVVIVVRRASGLFFDESLPGFHLYGTDIVQDAASAGLESYVVPMRVIHHSRRLIKLGSDYAAAYHFIRAKWRRELPVRTMMGDVTNSPIHLARLDLRVRRASGFARTRSAPLGDPHAIAAELGYEPRTSSRDR
jgi:hypothetical protein